VKELNEQSLEEAIRHIDKLKDDRGEKIALKPTYVFWPAGGRNIWGDNVFEAAERAAKLLLKMDAACPPKTQTAHFPR